MGRLLPPGHPVVTGTAMQRAEQALFDRGTASHHVMERAGRAVADAVQRFAPTGSVLVLAGPGNNGGDAWVAARLLAERQREVQVATLGEPRTPDAIAMRRLWQGDTVPLADAKPHPVLIDGLFGIGLSRALSDDVRLALHRLAAASRFSLAIDLPSGVQADTGDDLGAASMTATLTFEWLKPAHLLMPAMAKCGHVLAAPLDLRLADAAMPSEWRTLARPRLTPPEADAHKYRRGKLLVIGGAMPGAARLAARAALHGGAGYVEIAGAASGMPDAVVPRADWQTALTDGRLTAILVGPGMGGQVDRLDAALTADRPLVIDGDALTHLGGDAAARVRQRRAPTILTPHAGEFARMFGDGGGSKIDLTIAAAQQSGAVIVHKGPDSVIAAPDGRVILGASASPWLATAGTGDVLAGLIAARLAAGAPPLQAAEEALWLHGRAAALAGPALAADDLIPQLPKALAECLMP